jgi:hypothetical protein
MNRRLTAFGAGMGVLLFASVSGAQGKGTFGDSGQFIFSADRLFPLIAYTNNKLTNDNVNPNVTDSTSGSSVSLFYGGNSIGGGAGAGNSTFYTVPRLGFDYTVIPNLTVGGDLFLFFTLGGSTNSHCNGGTCTDTKGPSGNAWGLAPRVGYILGMTNLLSLWLRGGVSYYHATSNLDSPPCSNSNSTNFGVFGLDVDPQLVISPVNHFAFEVGPAIDWGFAGSYSNDAPNTQNCNTTTTTSRGYTSIHVGVTGGLFGWF